jgi:hypothetical protein
MVKKGLVLFLFIFSILLISTVSAGFFGNFFKSNKADLSPVDVDLTLGNSPPEVKRFFLLPIGLGSPSQQPFNPIAGAAQTYYLGFVVEDVNGKDDLPQGPTLTSSSSVSATITAPVNSINPLITSPINSCSSRDCLDPLVSAFCNNPPLQVAYICQGIFVYSDPPSTFSGASPNANDLWTIEATAHDLALLPSPTVTSGDIGFDTLPDDYVQINTLSAYDLGTAAIDWTALSITTPNQPATAPIAISNYGNIPLNTLEVTGSDLTGTNPINPSAILSISAFSASDSTGGTPDASCVVPTTATQLTTTPITIPGVSIPYTAQGSIIDQDNLYACVYQALNSPGILTGPSSITYGGIWDLTAT